MSTSTTTCGRCQADLATVPPGEPCPKCGGTALVHGEELREVATARDNLAWEQVRDHWERRPLALGVALAFTIGPPFLGLVLAGWPGVLVGLVFGVLAAVVGALALTRVREKERGR